MTILAVDDERLQLMRLVESIKDAAPQARVISFDNALKAYGAIDDTDVDVAFLDIEMGGMNGIELGKKLKLKNPKVNIVFVTGYLEYALDAHQMRASGYVTKPATAEKIRAELDNLRFPMPKPETGNKIRVRCFGDFEVYANGEPLKFERSKTKELFAFLVDRHGASCTHGRISAALWEEDKPSYLRTLISDLTQTLRSVGAGDVFVKRFGECYIVPEKLDCDYYDFEKGVPYAVRAYHGEYMVQYSWAEPTASAIENGL